MGYARDLWSEAPTLFNKRIASSKRARANGFCKNVVREFSRRYCLYRNISVERPFLRMADIELIEQSFQIAWGVLERTGELREPN